MKLINLRKSLKQDFISVGVDEIDVDYIISEVLGVSHTELNLIDDVTNEQLNQVNEVASLRMHGKPLDKIFNKKHFYGLKFIVDENVLSPRADSEILVEKAINIIKENNLKSVLDLCTGSGCIAIAIKKNVDAQISASDISTKALKIAKLNAKNLGAEINFIHSNMFEKIENKYDLIVSNPPYIATDEIEDLDVEVKSYDPLLALDGGELGLKYYNIIHDNAKKHLNDNGYLLLEIGEDQKKLVTSLFTDFDFLDCIKDYGGNDRVLVFSKK